MWVRHAVHGWAEAEVVQQLEGGRLRLRLPDGSNFTASGSDVRSRNAAGMDAKDALEDLEHIDEPNVLHALRSRFKAGKFYTWADHILVSTASSFSPSDPLVRPGIDFPPGTAVSLTTKLITRMSTREEPQSVIVSKSGVGASGCGARAAATALCQSLASVGRGAAGTTHAELACKLSYCIQTARAVMESFLAVDLGGGKQALAACTTTLFEFVEPQSEWKLANVTMVPSFVDWLRCKMQHTPGDQREGTMQDACRGAGSFLIMSQLLSAARTGSHTDLTKRLNPDLAHADLAGQAQWLEGWNRLLRGLRELGITKEELACIMHLVSIVLNLGALGQPRGYPHASPPDEPPTPSPRIASSSSPIGNEAEASPEPVSEQAVRSARWRAVCLALGFGDDEELMESATACTAAPEMRTGLSWRSDCSGAATEAVAALLDAPAAEAEAALVNATEAMLALVSIPQPSVSQSTKSAGGAGDAACRGSEKDRGSAGWAEGGRARGSVDLGSSALRIEALEVELYVCVVRYVQGRVNDALSRSAADSLRSTLSQHQGLEQDQQEREVARLQRRSIRVLESHGCCLPCGQGGVFRDGGGSGLGVMGEDDGVMAGGSGRGEGERSGGLTDLVVGIVNDVIMNRMRNLGREVAPECLVQALSSPPLSTSEAPSGPIPDAR